MNEWKLLLGVNVCVSGSVTGCVTGALQQTGILSRFSSHTELGVPMNSFKSCYTKDILIQ